MTKNATHWLPALQQGDEQAAERLWKEYFVKIVRLAKRSMDGLRLRAADEEDVALSAMNSFCRMTQNREEPIANSTELWKLLATIVKRKVNKERQRQFPDESIRSKILDGKSFTRLLVLPDGTLARFPFEMLIVKPDAFNPGYLLDHGPPVVYAPLVTMYYNLNRQNNAAKTTRSTLTVGNPNYEFKRTERPPNLPAIRNLRRMARMEKLNPLVGTQEETEWIVDSCRKNNTSVTPLVGAKAMEENIRKNLAGRTVVHLACHGFVEDDPKYEMFSGLAVTVGDQNDPKNNGVLELAEMFELRGELQSCEDGTCFNPIKRKMGVKEKFYIHVQAAVPVYVSLFQNYPDSQPASRQVYPDAQYPESFKAIQPEQATRLPVLFEMDDNTLDEIMSMVVVRADAPQIQSTLSTQATTSVTSTGGVTVVTAQATTGTAGTMKAINDGIVKGNDKEVKFIISGPVATTPAITPVPNDVAFYMLGAGFIGQWQLTLKK